MTDDDDHDFETAAQRDGRADDAGHSARVAQLALAAENGTLPEDLDVSEEVADDE